MKKRTRLFTAGLMAAALTFTALSEAAVPVRAAESVPFAQAGAFTETNAFTETGAFTEAGSLAENDAYAGTGTDVITEAVFGKKNLPVLSAHKYLKASKKAGVYTVKIPAERTLKLTLSGADSSEVKWSTTAKKTAYVENGVLYAVKKGKAVLKCKVGKQTLTVNVTVKKAKESYTEKTDVPVYRKDLTNEKITLRFYKDDPDIAYINMTDYQEICLPGTTLEAEKNGSKYLINKIDVDKAASSAAENGVLATAEVDAAKNFFYSDDILSFTNMMGLVQPGMDNAYLDGFPYTRFASMEVTGKSQFEGFDLAQYDIDIRADKNGVYMPVSTLSDIYSDLAYHFTTYSNGVFYVAPGMLFFSELHPYYTTKFKATGSRSNDEAYFSYNELCFAMDHFYGLPGRSFFGDEDLKTKGMDQTITDNNWGAFRELLLSTDPVEYAAGIAIADALFGDGGHSGFKTAIKEVIDTADQDTMAKYQELAGQFLKEAGLYEMYYAQRDEMYERYYGNFVRSDLRREQMGDEFYCKSGDTALIAMDSFMPISDNSDLDAWEAFYNGETDERPTGSDGGWPSIFLDGLEKAAADKDIKKVVIDDSNNGGGSLDMVVLLTSIMTGSSSVYCYNTLTGQNIKMNYDVDRNFDRVFDEKDKEVVYDQFDYAVLTGSWSFSCGNLFPSMMKDEGVMIIGEQSGGGACAIQYMTTADGAEYRISSHRSRLENKAGENIDSGVPVDKELVPRDAEGNFEKKEYTINPFGSSMTVKLNNYDDFYDLKAISQYIDEFYTDQEELPDAA